MRNPPPRATPRAPEPWSRLDGLVLVCLGVLGLAATALARRALDAGGLALGGDAVLWGLTAKNLQDGFIVSMNPGYPLWVAIVERLSGATLVDAGLSVSAAAAAGVPPAVWWVSRDLGARRWHAAMAVLATLLAPRVAVFGLQIQPDALTMLTLLVVVPLGRRFVERPSLARLLPLVCWVGFAVLLREHTLLAGALLGLVVVAVSRGWRQHTAFGAILLAVVVLAPAIAGQRPGLPWQWSWAERMMLPVRGEERPRMPNNEAEVAFDGTHRAAHAQEDQAEIVRHHALYALAESPAGWGTLSLALVCALLLGRGRRLVALVPLLTPLPGLLILSQDRHVLVAMPVALATVGAAISRPGLVGRVGWLGLFAAASAHLSTLPVEWDEARTRLRDARASRADGEALCAARGPEDLVEGGYPTLLLYCPTRRLAQPWLRGTAAEWHTWGFGLLGPGWEPAETRLSTQQLFRLAPGLRGPARPCAASRPTAPHPWLVFAAASPGVQYNEGVVVWEPACEVDPMAFFTN